MSTLVLVVEALLLLFCCTVVFHVPRAKVNEMLVSPESIVIVPVMPTTGKVMK
jgi:membrane protein CcdC involved in cytochrome C biogenesis